MTDSGPATSPGAAASNLPELSVSELSFAVKRTMETTFDRVRVRGELGRVVAAKSGHLYTDLKDENASLSVVMWRSTAQQLKFKPEEGLEVVVEGKLSTFPGRSAYQLIADRMEPAGIGALLAQLERLKQKLATEGLFARERKKPIPFLPETIGVITSPTGAVIRDILHRLEERFPRRVLLWPVLVQGEHAAGQVAAAIRGFNEMQGALRPDVLIVARGGGSIEDLWAFNEEIVVRAAAESAIPLISAVGHETDTTLIDFASDLRAPTPTGAAEKAVPVRTQLVGQVEGLGARLTQCLTRGMDVRRTELRAAAGRLPKPEALLALAQQRFDRAADRLGGALLTNERAAQARLDRIAARLRLETLQQDIARRAQRLGELQKRLAAAVQRGLADDARKLVQTTRLLETLSHKSVLARGFALVTTEGGAVVRTARSLAPGDAIRIAFADGTAPAVVNGADARKRPKPVGGGQGSLF